MKQKDCTPKTALTALSLMAIWAVSTASAGSPERWEVVMQATRHYMHEQCIEIDKGQRLAYRVTTPRPVDFNIHHHGEAGTEFPVKTTIERSLEGELPVSKTGEYCFMWETPRQMPDAFVVKLNYQIIED